MDEIVSAHCRRAFGDFLRRLPGILHDLARLALVSCAFRLTVSFISTSFFEAVGP